MSTPGMVEIPRLLGEAKGVVLWSRAALQVRRAHEVGPQGAPDLDPEVSKKGAGGPCGHSCARLDSSNSHGARVDDFVG